VLQLVAKKCNTIDLDREAFVMAAMNEHLIHLPFLDSNLIIINYC
jgi:hypothetical protein